MPYRRPAAVTVEPHPGFQYVATPAVCKVSGDARALWAHLEALAPLPMLTESGETIDEVRVAHGLSPFRLHVF